MSSKIMYQNLPDSEDIKNKLQPNLNREFTDYLSYFIKVLLVVSLVYIFIRTSVFDTIAVEGSSMSPNYENGDVIYIDQITPKFGEYKRGEVVVLVSPTNPNVDPNKKELFIKRVIGLPGDTVTIDNGKVFITNGEFPDGVQLDEKAYLDPSVKTCKDVQACVDIYDKQVLSKDEYYVLGDNRRGSNDSRVFGKIKKSSILGREFYRVLPVNKSGTFTLPKYNNVPN